MSEDDDEISAELCYPRTSGGPQQVRVSLLDVRAASELVIRYDFERDGWALFMDQKVEHPGWFEVVAEDQEVGFIPAWNIAPADPQSGSSGNE